MSDKELEEWLEKRWMGRYLNVLTDNGWDDLNAIQACSDEEAKSIISLFEKSGHQLKMRILLQELRGTSLEDNSAPGSSSHATSATSSSKQQQQQQQQQDDSDSDAEAPASSDDDDDEDVPPPKAASPVLPSTNKWGDKVTSNTTSTTSAASAASSSSSAASSTPSWVKSKPTASPTSPTKTIDHTRKDSDVDLPPAPMGFTATSKPKSSPTQTTRAVEPVKPVAVASKNSPTFGSTPPLPPPPNLSGDSGYNDDEADDDNNVPPLPDDSSDSSDDDEGSGKSGKSSPAASPPAGPTKASPFSSQPQATITGNGAKNWGAKPVSSPTTTTPSGGGIKDRMNALNNNNSNSSSPPLKPTTFGGGGLKDRMNALQQSASSTSSSTTSKNPAPSIRAGDVQGRIGALAGMIKIQAPGQSHPLFGKTRPQQQQEEVEEDVEGNADPDAGDDYEIPPANALDEPQKEGWLEKRGNGRHRDELTQMYVVLKDDCLYWLRSTDDQFPTGMICLTEPGLTTTMLEGDELEITSRKRTYRFRAPDGDELSGWHSKIRVAKMLHTSGAKPKTSAKAAPHLANQVASKAMGAAFMANKDQHTEAKTYTSPKFNQAPQGRIQPGAISNRDEQSSRRDEPKRQQQRHDDDDDDDDDDAAPPPAVEDDDDDDDDNDDGIQYSGRGAPQQQSNNNRRQEKDTTQTSARAAVASPKQSPRKEEEPPEYRRYKDMLKIGSMFQKFKRGKGKKRLIWCPLSLDRILWGDEKKKKVKGYMMVCDIQKVTHGCLGAKKPGNALTIHSTERTLDLEAPDTQQKNDWINAVEMLIDTYRR